MLTYSVHSRGISGCGDNGDAEQKPREYIRPAFVGGHHHHRSGPVPCSMGSRLPEDRQPAAGRRNSVGSGSLPEPVHRRSDPSLICISSGHSHSVPVTTRDPTPMAGGTLWTQYRFNSSCPHAGTGYPGVIIPLSFGSRYLRPAGPGTGPVSRPACSADSCVNCLTAAPCTAGRVQTDLCPAGELDRHGHQCNETGGAALDLFRCQTPVRLH